MLTSALSFSTMLLIAPVVNCPEIVCACMFVSSTDSLMSGILIANVICTPSDNKRRRPCTVPVCMVSLTVMSDMSTPASSANIFLNDVTTAAVRSPISTGILISTTILTIADFLSGDSIAMGVVDITGIGVGVGVGMGVATVVGVGVATAVGTAVATGVGTGVGEGVVADGVVVVVVVVVAVVVVVVVAVVAVVSSVPGIKHVVAAERDVVPFRHRLHSKYSALSPALQGIQLVIVVGSSLYPGGHGVHVSVPLSGAAVPGGHLLHDL